MSQYRQPMRGAESQIPTPAPRLSWREGPVRYEAWRPLPKPESGSPARGIVLAVLISAVFWVGVATLL